ncbi:hypothetical protein ABND78_09425 [Paenibacillus larvae]
MIHIKCDEIICCCFALDLHTGLLSPKSNRGKHLQVPPHHYNVPSRENNLAILVQVRLFVGYKTLASIKKARAANLLLGYALVVDL